MQYWGMTLKWPITNSFETLPMFQDAFSCFKVNLSTTIGSHQIHHFHCYNTLCIIAQKSVLKIFLQFCLISFCAS